MKKLLLILLIVCGIVNLGYSQSNISIKASLLGSGVGITHISMKCGYKIGVTKSFQISEKIYFEPGLNFANKGFKFEPFDYTCNLNFVELPLNLVFKKQISENWKFDLGYYLYFSWGLWGKYDQSYFKESVWGKDERNWLSNRRGIIGNGLNIGLEYKKMYFGIGAEIGFNELRSKTLEIPGEIDYNYVAPKMYKDQSIFATVGFSF